MDANTYQNLALRTESAEAPLRGFFGDSNNNNRLLHAGIGMATEAAEFIDPIKKFLFYNKPIDKTNLKEEIGDLLWYVAIACSALGTTVEEEMERNITKLAKRYPEKFTSEAAINRDLEAERKVLEVDPNTVEIKFRDLENDTIAAIKL
jgi:NTP pyrophosphatase (non-canonical NTP hydrolase)